MNGGSLAEKAGLCVGDNLIRVNSTDIYQMRHKEAQDTISRAGNNFELVVSRFFLFSLSISVAWCFFFVVSTIHSDMNIEILFFPIDFNPHFNWVDCCARILPSSGRFVNCVLLTMFSVS